MTSLLDRERIKELAFQLYNVMRRIFHQESRGYDTAVRTKALRYLLDPRPNLEQLRRIFLETRDPWETEFDLYVQVTLYNLAEKDKAVRYIRTSRPFFWDHEFQQVNCEMTSEVALLTVLCSALLFTGRC